jgi:leucyl/phenylalanyl-tRNA--protein transferase
MKPFLTLLDDKSYDFPSPELALEEPNGLIAMGGDLSTKRLLKAYQKGIFPWYQPEQPILWWSPNPRCVLLPDEIHLSRSLRKAIRQSDFECTTDQAFEQVMRQCGSIRARQEGTWISEDMIQAYCQLHTLGYAHSIEVWQQERLVGGLYGLTIFPCFFGESMFSRATNASKMAMFILCDILKQQHYRIIDCQVENDHLLSMGARCIPRKDFLSFLNNLSISKNMNWPITGTNRISLANALK